LFSLQGVPPGGSQGMFERKSNKSETREQTAAPQAASAPETGAASQTAAAPGSNTTSGARAMIGAKVKVNGDIISSEDLLVEGEVNGTITLSDNELVIGGAGKVQANVSAKTVRIEGEVRGDIEGKERVIICASGDVQGNVTSPRVMLEDGGRFKGSIDMGSPKGSGSGTGAAAIKPAAESKPEVHSMDKAG
jgi:cytoskeletal protein CcmA (bactofilin family)